MLTFTRVQLEDYDRIYHYTSRYGEGSCQHSAVGMYALYEKYGDLVCEKDGFLYVHRAFLDDDVYRVYLAPLGNGDIPKAFRNIIADAREFGKKAKFLTLTRTYAECLEEALPGRFRITEHPDLAEYVYRTEKMAYFQGKELRKRRQEAARFWKLYGDCAEVTRINGDDFVEMLEYEKEWLVQCCETHDMEALEREERMIRKQLDNFDRLKLSGVVLRVAGRVRGFSYGTKLNADYYDAIAEKGDRELEHVYKVLRQESVRQCAMDCTYVNLEEDVGVPGLRALKKGYQPEFMIRKYIAEEF